MIIYANLAIKENFLKIDNNAYGCVGFGMIPSDGFFGKIPEQRKEGDIF